MEIFDKPTNIAESYGGIKESDSKLNVEYNWDFLKSQLTRMGRNKDKYPAYNWTKPMNIEELKAAMFRHVLEVMNGNYHDATNDDLEHLAAISLNCMFIYTQLKRQDNEIQIS